MASDTLRHTSSWLLPVSATNRWPLSTVVPSGRLNVPEPPTADGAPEVAIWSTR